MMPPPREHSGVGDKLQRGDLCQYFIGSGHLTLTD